MQAKIVSSRSARKTKASIASSRLSPFHEPECWIAENDLAFAIPDAYPLSVGHTLVVPKRRVTATTQLAPDELLACFDLVERVKESLRREGGAQGFNVGVNEGVVAGQTVDQLHIHVIPRYPGDLPNPIGGIRNIFPGQGDYLRAKPKITGRD